MFLDMPFWPRLCHCASCQEAFHREPLRDIPRRLRVVFYPQFHLYPCNWSSCHLVKGLEPGLRYRTRFVDPRNGAETPIGEVTGDADGSWRVPAPSTMHDWLLIMGAAAGDDARSR